MKHTRTKITDNVSILILEDGTKIRIWTHTGSDRHSRVLEVQVDGKPLTELRMVTRKPQGGAV